LCYIGSHQLYLEFFFLHLHVSPPLLLIVLILVKCVIPRRDWKCHSDEGNEEVSEGNTSESTLAERLSQTCVTS
jgi:hypothetical protein